MDEEEQAERDEAIGFLDEELAPDCTIAAKKLYASAQDAGIGQGQLNGPSVPSGQVPQPGFEEGWVWTRPGAKVATPRRGDVIPASTPLAPLAPFVSQSQMLPLPSKGEAKTAWNGEGSEQGEGANAGDHAGDRAPFQDPPPFPAAVSGGATDMSAHLPDSLLAAIQDRAHSEAEADELVRRWQRALADMEAALSASAPRFVRAAVCASSRPSPSPRTGLRPVPGRRDGAEVTR